VTKPEIRKFEKEVVWRGRLVAHNQYILRLQVLVPAVQRLEVNLKCPQSVGHDIPIHNYPLPITSCNAPWGAFVYAVKRLENPKHAAPKFDDVAFFARRNSVRKVLF
jgi:hypothetical protein